MIKKTFFNIYISILFTVPYNVCTHLSEREPFTANDTGPHTAVAVVVQYLLHMDSRCSLRIIADGIDWQTSHNRISGILMPNRYIRSVFRFVCCCFSERDTYEIRIKWNQNRERTPATRTHTHAWYTPTRIHKRPNEAIKPCRLGHT